MIANLATGVILIAFVRLVVLLVRSLRGSEGVRSLKGPRTSSRLLGYEYDLSRQEDVGGLESQWVREYGPTWRISGAFATDVLMTADPKALQHIFHKSAYNYGKQASQNHMGYIMSGPNIVWADGEVYHRHRKIMNPAFSTAQLRSFLLLFQAVGHKLSEKWKAELASHKEVEVFVNRWLSRAALDIIGAAAFDYDYKAMDEADESALAKAYHGIFKDVNFRLSKAELILRASWDYLPFPILKLFAYVPARTFNHVRYVKNLYMTYGKQILGEKRSEVDAEKRAGEKDVVTILVKANESSDEKTRLNEEEILAQMYTLTLAGHETTATTLTFLLYELAKNPEYQARMRQEIREARTRVLARGDIDFTMEDLDGMTLCLNAIKETLRMHPVVTQIQRVAMKDDVLPLAHPIVTDGGQIVTAVPVRKGQVVNASLAMYNRQVMQLPAMTIKALTYSVTGFPRMSFSAGTRACLGWRFAVMEMQVLVAELVGTFRFDLPAELESGMFEVLRGPAGNTMFPFVRGKVEHDGAVTLRVALAS
ncbi:hypothetical protein BN946_scf184969.g41 [Trametes cinnabarina]|uniref:Cytochrome P450 n=1 Tax=Pycnoporus cinnabarinus TaxID=5643 RepID=A0A060STG2_PYCCI|nr:hypothetical protein BN946_scf184969.g41 [Trametes cinnabarina]